MKKVKIEIIIPKGAETNIDFGLIELTKFLTKKVFKGKRQNGGFLGGEYGVNYENDVFMMHSYCWCEKENCKWCNGDVPNFLYKPINTKIWWYKWIGRDTKIGGGKLPKDWLKKCKESINKIKS